MKSVCMHPADQLVAIMDRIYENGLTTTSGGNLSILEENGDIWITPSGIDKGALTRSDICCVKADGTVIGPHKPSVELPFHKLVYKNRPDIRAVLHAHPPKLVAFSVARRLPEMNLTSNARHACGNITMASYAVPGSLELGEKVAAEFDLVLLRGNINMDDFIVSKHDAEECALRRDMVVLMKRAYKQGLLGSTSGTFSARLSGGGFLITPYGTDRAYLSEDDLVLINGDMKEYGKTPSRSVRLHKMIYDRHPHINAVLGAQPPHAMAFAVTNAPFDSRTIPESYIQLRDMQKVGFTAIYREAEKVVEAFSEKTPVLICENNQILATGGTLLTAFDRLEVCEATAHSIIATKDIGEIVHITGEEIRDIDKAFGL